MEVLSQNSHPSQNLGLNGLHTGQEHDFEQNEIEFGEFRSNEDAKPMESHIGLSISDLDVRNPSRDQDFKVDQGSDHSAIASGTYKSKGNPDIPKSLASGTPQLVNLPISANSASLVSGLFRPSEELLSLLEECRLLLEELEVLDNTALLRAPDRLEQCHKLVAYILLPGKKSRV